MNRIIVIGQPNITEYEKSLIQDMVRRIVSATEQNVVWYGGRGQSKTFTSQYVKKAVEYIDHIETRTAMNIQDSEGYVHIGGFGKIHIQNWIDRDMQKTKEALSTDKIIFSGMDFGSIHSQQKTFIDWLKPMQEYCAEIKKEKSEKEELTAFQQRFTSVKGYSDPSGKEVRLSSIIDTKTNKSYTSDQFDALYFRAEKIFNDNYPHSALGFENITSECLDSILESIDEADQISLEEQKTTLPYKRIKLNAAEIQSGISRVHWAEGLILQLPKDHDGRNSWLLNYGIREEAIQLRRDRNIGFNSSTKSAAKNGEL